MVAAASRVTETGHAVLAVLRASGVPHLTPFLMNCAIIAEVRRTSVEPYTFLSALPALLGLAGFVLYQVLGANKSGDEISRRIIEKLRSGVTGEITPDQRLTPKQVERLLEQQQRLRKIVGEQDFHLLKQALTQQFIITVLVYVLTLVFCSLSVYLFAQSPAAQKKAGAASEQQIHQNQSSTGRNSPNVSSSGSGPTTVTIQDQATPTPPAKQEEKK